MADSRDELIDAATRAGEAVLARQGVLAAAASYDRARGVLRVTLANGAEASFPAALIQGLAEATEDQRAEVEVAGIGYGLHWPSLDLDLSVAGLLAEVYGTADWMRRQQAARGGAARSSAKSAAARLNGSKGGRPRKRVP